MYKNNKKIIFLGFIISIFFFLIFIKTKDIEQNKNSAVSPPISTSTQSQTEKITTAFLEINGEKLETKIERGESVYDFMVTLEKEGKISFKDETYAGMGKLIEEINGLKNGDKNWIYYVNGKKANIGISNYKINPGDVVSWKYETYND